MIFKYKPSVLEELATYGIFPNENTPPELVMGHLKSLYVVEIRKLRDRLREGHFHKSEYISRIMELRRRYPLLSIPVQLWVLSHGED